MNKLMTILLLFILLCISCSAEEEEIEITERTKTSDTVRIKAVDYIPLSTNESSKLDTKRKRKFYIRK